MEVTIKDFWLGLILVLFLTVFVYGVFRFIAPNSHFNFLECYGIVMILASINNLRTFYKEAKKKEDADIS